MPGLPCSPTECFEEVLRDDDIAKDAFAVVNTRAVTWDFQRTDLGRNRRTPGRWMQHYTIV